MRGFCEKWVCFHRVGFVIMVNKPHWVFHAESVCYMSRMDVFIRGYSNIFLYHWGKAIGCAWNVLQSDALARDKVPTSMSQTLCNTLSCCDWICPLGTTWREGWWVALHLKSLRQTYLYLCIQGKIEVKLRSTESMLCVSSAFRNLLILFEALVLMSVDYFLCQRL